MWPLLLNTANCPSMRVPWRARWERGSLRSPPGSRRAHERCIGFALADHLALARSRLEPARVDSRRLSLAYLRHRCFAIVGAAARTAARQPLHLRLGNPVCHPLPGLCPHRTLGQPAGALGGGHEPAAGVRLVLRYDFVLACFSSSSRMKGMVSRRCSTIEASSSASRI